MLLGAVQLTRAPPVAGAVAVTPVGAVGAVAGGGAVGVTGLDGGEICPSPPAFDACTVKVYVWPAVRPEIVVVVAGGVPVTVVAFCAVVPMKGVIL